MAYTVSTVAEIAGVTVRALHHYDRIGLLKPEQVSPAGYRLYSDSELRDLQQILFFRELGFSLSDIARIIHSPGFDRREALAQHRRLLESRRERLDRLIASVDLTLGELEGEKEMNNNTLFEGFDSSEYEKYRKEASERWGKDVVDRSYERVGNYTPAEWAAIRAEAADIERSIIGLMGEAPDDARVLTQIGRWFEHMRQYYHEFSPEAFRGLGDMYTGDDRFRAYYEQRAIGLAEFMRAAMHAWADHAGKQARA